MKCLFNFLPFIALIFATSLTTNAQETYKVGDLYSNGSIMGIVVLVDEDGLHGTIMSMKSSKEKWCANKTFDFSTKAFSQDDGQKNMAAIEEYVNSGETGWESFPIFNWARSMGEGWYIPACNEILEAWKSMNGGSINYSQSKKGAFRQFDEAQKKLGGDPLVDSRFKIGDNLPYLCYSSSETDGGGAYAVKFAPDFMSMLKSSEFAPFPAQKRAPMVRTRAYHKF